jgi:hypothetical protein
VSLRSWVQLVRRQSRKISRPPQARLMLEESREVRQELGVFVMADAARLRDVADEHPGAGDLDERCSADVAVR